MFRGQNRVSLEFTLRPELGTSVYKSLEAERQSRMVVARDLEEGEERLCNGYRVPAL